MTSTAGFLFGAFLALHGLVHLWYVTLAQRWIEYQADMGWTGDSWALGGLLDLSSLQGLATAAYALAAVAFVGTGAGWVFGAEWGRPALITAAVFSTVVVLGFWDGGLEMLVQKGVLAVVINIGVLGALLITD